MYSQNHFISLYFRYQLNNTVTLLGQFPIALIRMSDPAINNAYIYFIVFRIYLFIDLPSTTYEKRYRLVDFYIHWRGVLSCCFDRTIVKLKRVVWIEWWSVFAFIKKRYIFHQSAQSLFLYKKKIIIFYKMY